MAAHRRLALSGIAGGAIGGASLCDRAGLPVGEGNEAWPRGVRGHGSAVARFDLRGASSPRVIELTPTGDAHSSPPPTTRPRHARLLCPERTMHVTALEVAADPKARA